VSEREVALTDEKWVRFWNRKQAWKENQGNQCDLSGYSGAVVPHSLYSFPLPLTVFSLA